MPVRKMTAYPKTVDLRESASVTLRPMTAADETGLLDFFKDLPEDDRYFLKDDVTSPRTIKNWAEHLDYDRALPMLALDNGRIVGDAVLVRHRGGALGHSAEIRVSIDPAYRGKGLGSAMLRELVAIAADAELDQVVFEGVSGIHDGALDAARSLGALEAGVVQDIVKDRHGDLHDIIFLRLPLGKWYEWQAF